jgi:hypothetical protein
MRGGSGKCTGGSNTESSAGVTIMSSTTVDFVNNFIDGGTGTGCVLAPTGVETQGTPKFDFYGNRVLGTSSGNYNSSGLWIGGSASGSALVNNMILGSTSTTQISSGAVIFTMPNGVIEHNTFSGGAGGYAHSIVLHNGEAMTIEDNIFFGALSGSDQALWLENCASTGPIKSLKNNLFFNFSNGPLEYGGGPESPCAAYTTFTTLDAMSTELTTRCSASTTGACASFGGTQVSGNVTLRGTCTSETGCIVDSACTSASGCASSVFAGWTANDYGYTTLVSTGWKLQAGESCSVTKGALDVGITTDFYGTLRTTPYSMGAAEFDGTCN